MSEDNDHKEILANKINGFGEELEKFTNVIKKKELLKIIKQPLWTTPAEFAFAVAIVDSMHTHVEAINILNEKLLEASKLVGIKDSY